MEQKHVVNFLIEEHADIYRTNSNNGQSALSIMKQNEVKYAIWKELIDKYDPK